MQVMMICHDYGSAAELNDDMNSTLARWLKGKPDIEIVKMEQSLFSGPDEQGSLRLIVLITIFYQEREK